GTLTATAATEAETGIRKQLLVRMAPVGSAVTVIHTLTNTLPWPIELAPWAISMMAQGGIVITGFPRRSDAQDQLRPSNPLAMWSYSNFADPRVTLTRGYLVMRHDAAIQEPNKFGLFHPKTWGGCL